MQSYKSEIRDSIIRDLLDKVRKQSYEKYLLSIRLEKIRRFQGAQITFDFPVTALIGPNGSGKSTILNAAACAYTNNHWKFFPKSRIGDESMDDWQIEYEVINKKENPRGTIRSSLRLKADRWSSEKQLGRETKFFNIERTVPVAERPMFALRNKLRATYRGKGSISTKRIDNIEHIKKQAEKILGKSLVDFELYEITATRTKKITKKVEVTVDGKRVIKREPIGKERIISARQLMFVGIEGTSRYSEFNFGAGESSVIRIVSEVETIPSHSLVFCQSWIDG